MGFLQSLTPQDPHFSRKPTYKVKMSQRYVYKWYPKQLSKSMNVLYLSEFNKTMGANGVGAQNI